jgi:hypothetical protein
MSPEQRRIRTCISILHRILLSPGIDPGDLEQDEPREFVQECLSDLLDTGLLKYVPLTISARKTETRIRQLHPTQTLNYAIRGLTDAAVRNRKRYSLSLILESILRTHISN